MDEYVCVLMANVFLLLGANLGDKLGQLQAARQLICAEIAPIMSESAIYETESWGSSEPQPSYLNQVVLLQSDREPEALLYKTQAIEARLGRVRKEKWGARVIDIDILFYGTQVVNLPDLQIPHLFFTQRNFAMQPMAEIAGDFIHPVLGKSVEELLSESSDQLEVRIYRESEFSFLKEMTGGDPVMTCHILQLVLDQLPQQLEKLQESLEQVDWKAAEIVIHDIKPTLTYMGAVDLRKQIEAIELTFVGKKSPDSNEMTASIQHLLARFDLLMTEIRIYFTQLQNSD